MSIPTGALLDDLWHQLKPWHRWKTKAQQEDIKMTLRLWLKDNFEEVHVQRVISNRVLIMCNDRKDYESAKAWELKTALHQVVEFIGCRFGFGREKVAATAYPHFAYANNRKHDYRPAWLSYEDANLPAAHLEMSFLILRRQPLSWGKEESLPDWKKRLT